MLRLRHDPVEVYHLSDSNSKDAQPSKKSSIMMRFRSSSKTPKPYQTKAAASEVTLVDPTAEHPAKEDKEGKETVSTKQPQPPKMTWSEARKLADPNRSWEARVGTS